VLDIGKRKIYRASATPENSQQRSAQIENNGFMEWYLYTDSHEAIISDEIFMVAP